MTNPQTTTVYSQPKGDLVTSAKRTVVPTIVGLAGGWLAKRGFNIDSDFLTFVISGFILNAYYNGLRLLEHFKSSKWGWLLGAAKAPVYSVGSQTDIVATVETPAEVPVTPETPAP